MISSLMGLIFITLFSSFWSIGVLIFSMILLLSIMMLKIDFMMTLNMVFLGGQMGSMLVFLTLMLVLLSFMATPSNKSKWYLTCLGFLGLILILAFTSSNLLSFYIFFEASLVPTLILIICWGYQPERLQAGSYMMLYTVTASLPLLFLLLNLTLKTSTFNIALMSQLKSFEINEVVVLILYGAFLVKLPLYSFHLWLPKAHVEAPLAGSMMLAGILLKLGGYGLYQMNNCFNLLTKMNVMYFLMALAMWGSIMSCLMCMRQNDMKALVAYSSVAHMSLVVVGVLMNSQWGMVSVMIMLFAHGTTSSALFCMTYFTYEKVNTRSMVYIKGLLQVYPYISYFWFVLCSVNMAAPPTLNLLSELMIVPCLWKISYLFIIIMGLLVFLSASYNMFMYSSLNHGFQSSYLLPSKNMKSFEMNSIICHLVPLCLILKSELFVFLLEI
nr:NADH dehydrogenase subunit 4 [Lymnaea stagnalis]